jgi:hypothetical protein
LGSRDEGREKGGSFADTELLPAQSSDDDEVFLFVVFVCVKEEESDQSVTTNMWDVPSSSRWRKAY